MINLNALLNLPFPLVLASKSPRRQHLMRHVGFTFDVVSPDVNEDSVAPEPPYSGYVEHLATLKAERGAELYGAACIAIGSDTTVVLGDTVLNKPANEAEAFTMLRMLSGNTHQVYTGLSLVATTAKGTYRHVVSSVTNVTFRQLDDTEIQAYVSSGSPMDKAGGYGIQDDFGAVFVSRVEGCYYTVVGLPVEMLYVSLRNLVKHIT